MLGTLIELTSGAIQYPKTQVVQDFSEFSYNKTIMNNFDRDRLKMRTSQLESNGNPKFNNSNIHESSNPQNETSQ